MPRVTCVFSTLGVQNVIPNGCWSVTAITSKKPSAYAHGKATDLENRIAYKILSTVRLPWQVNAMVNLPGFYTAVVFLWRFWLRIAPLSLIPSCVMWKKTARKNGHVKSWGRDLCMLLSPVSLLIQWLMYGPDALANAVSDSLLLPLLEWFSFV